MHGLHERPCRFAKMPQSVAIATLWVTLIHCRLNLTCPKCLGPVCFGVPVSWDWGILVFPVWFSFSKSNFVPDFSCPWNFNCSLSRKLRCGMVQMWLHVHTWNLSRISDFGFLYQEIVNLYISLCTSSLQVKTVQCCFPLEQCSSS